MTLFDNLDIARSGLRTHHTWVDAIADNIANANTVRPMDEAAFQARYVEAVSLNRDRTAAGKGGGVGVSEIRESSAEGIVSYEPDNPLANEDGLVRRPDMDFGAQMASLIVAQRAYQANVSVMERARDAYQTALSIGEGARG